MKANHISMEVEDKAMKALTKEELVHLIFTSDLFTEMVARLIKTRKAQVAAVRRIEAGTDSSIDLCFDCRECRNIEKKLKSIVGIGVFK